MRRGFRQFLIENVGRIWKCRTNTLSPKITSCSWKAPFQLGAGSTRQVSLPIAGNATLPAGGGAGTGIPALLGSPFASASPGRLQRRQPRLFVNHLPNDSTLHRYRLPGERRLLRPQ